MAEIETVGIPDFETAPGLLVHRRVTIRTEPGEAEGIPYALEVTVEPQSGVFTVTRLLVTQSAGGPPIQRGELAKIRTENFVRMAASKSLATRAKGGRKTVGQPGPSDDFYERVAQNGLTDDDLPELVEAYRWIRLQEGKPTTILSSELRLSLSTVRRWLAKAVDRGLLTNEERVR